MHETGGFCLAVIKALQEWLEGRVQQDACRDRDSRHEQQNEDTFEIGAVVAACDSFAHCVHRILKRHHTVQHLEELRQHLDGVSAAGACDLNDQYDDRERLADIAECEHEAVVYKRRDKARERRGKPEQERVIALDADVEEVAEHGYERRELADRKENEVSAEVGFRSSKSGEFRTALDVRMHEADAQQCACPDGQNGVERCHAGTEVFERVYPDNLEVSRGGEVFNKAADVVLHEVEDV